MSVPKPDGSVYEKEYDNSGSVVKTLTQKMKKQVPDDYEDHKYITCNFGDENGPHDEDTIDLGSLLPEEFVEYVKNPPKRKFAPISKSANPVTSTTVGNPNNNNNNNNTETNSNTNKKPKPNPVTTTTKTMVAKESESSKTVSQSSSTNTNTNSNSNNNSSGFSTQLIRKNKTMQTKDDERIPLSRFMNNSPSKSQSQENSPSKEAEEEVYTTSQKSSSTTNGFVTPSVNINKSPTKPKTKEEKETQAKERMRDIGELVFRGMCSAAGIPQEKAPDFAICLNQLLKEFAKESK